MFGIYVHWPFCAAKCPYCDFNSHVRDRVDQQDWRDAFDREIAFYAEKTPDRLVTSIFFGGGTPSLMEPETIESVLASIRKHWPITNDCEITMEANPTSVESSKFAAFHAVGIDRVSIGVQALNDNDLKFLGRQHDTKQAIAAIETAQKHFSRTSFDLIYARPDQTPEHWQTELRDALRLADGHLSLYQLTIEKGTPFYTRFHRGEFTIPDQDDGGALYEITQDTLEQAGMPAYEISNHAAAGQESQHNMTYWRYEDYLGIGPGAHGRFTAADGVKTATRAHAAPEIWLKRVAENGHGANPFEPIDRDQRLTETLMMGLRLRDGIPLAKLSAEAGRDWLDIIDPAKITNLENENYLELSGTHLIATKEGRQRLNGLLTYLLPADN